jgi:alkyl hydroperoxide reductase subunit AhpC
MAIRLGEIAPDFQAQTTEGPIQFHKWLGDGWGIPFALLEYLAPHPQTQY